MFQSEAGQRHWPCVTHNADAVAQDEAPVIDGEMQWHFF